VSHPIPLHPDADLAVVLDDMRQSVAAWGDEGMVMRVFRARICLALLSILDTLLDLLADFRAGRLPPVLPAHDEAAPRSRRSVVPAATIPAQPETPSPEGAAARPIRAPRDGAPRAAPADAPEKRTAAMTLRRCSPLWASHRPIVYPADAPRAIAGTPSRVPRPPWRAFGSNTELPTHAHFVTISNHSAIAPRSGTNKRSQDSAAWTKLDSVSIRRPCQISGLRVFEKNANDTPDSGSPQHCELPAPPWPNVVGLAIAPWLLPGLEPRR
jgi:hypothetical protein